MIEIISGCTRIGSRTVSAADGPFITTPEIEKRLVDLGVARYLNAAASPVPAAPDEGAETSASTGQPENAAEGEKTAFLDPGQFSDMNFAQVKKLAKDMGLDVDGVNTKKALVEMIIAVPVEVGGEEEIKDGETPPNLNAEDPVV